MTESKEEIHFNTDSWKVRINERRNGRMQLRFNLDKDEALGFKGFTEMVKPEHVSEEVFIKSIFLQGVRAMQEQLAELVKQYAEANPDELEKMGVEVVEGNDGSVSLEETSSDEEE